MVDRVGKRLRGDDRVNDRAAVTAHDEALVRRIHVAMQDARDVVAIINAPAHLPLRPNN